MVRLDVYDVSAIYVLVKLMTRPYHGEKFFLNLGVSGLNARECSWGITHRLTFLHEDSSETCFRCVTLNSNFFVYVVVFEYWIFSQILLHSIKWLLYASSVVSPNPAMIKSSAITSTNLQSLHKFVHGSLPYFWSRADAKGHLKPMVSSKESVESSFVAALVVCQNPSFAFTTVKSFALSSRVVTSSIVGIG